MLRARAALAPSEGQAPGGTATSGPRGDPPGQARSRAAFCLGIEFHFQLLLGSHGSLQTFDNEAKYT